MAEALPLLIAAAMLVYAAILSRRARDVSERATRLVREVRTGEPMDAPRNVRLQLDDGTVLPVELRYRGCLDGVDHWMGTTTVTRDQIQQATILAEYMPTPISLNWEIADADAEA